MVFIGRFSVQVKNLMDGKIKLQESEQRAREAVLHIRADIWDVLLFRSGDRQTPIKRLDQQAAIFYEARRNLSAPLFLANDPGIYSLDSDFRVYYLFAKDILALPDLRAFTTTPDYTRKFQDNENQLMRRLDSINIKIQDEFASTLRDLDSGLRITVFMTTLFPCLAIGLSIILSLFLPRRITLPLRQLDELTRLAAAGNYHLRAGQGTTGHADVEIAALAGSINHLLVEIQAYREHMEELVADRTRQIEESNDELQTTLDNLKETQEQLIQSEKMAAMGTLVAGVAHEINTPIGNSITTASFLESRVAQIRAEYASGDLLKSSLEDFLAITGESARILETNLKKAGALVTSFRQLSVDQQTNERRRFKLHDYIGEIIVSHQTLFDKSRIAIHNRTDSDLEVDTNHIALYQILSKLLVNSLRHGFPEGEEGEITITAWSSQANAILEYKDNGKGIPAEVRNKIFDPFFTSLRNHGGSGFGLYIASNLAGASLGGRLKLVETPSPGVHFRLEFPLLLPSRIASMHAASRLPPTSDGN